MWCSTDKISLSINHQATTKKKNGFLIMLGIMGKKNRTILIVGELEGKDKNL